MCMCARMKAFNAYILWNKNLHTIYTYLFVSKLLHFIKMRTQAKLSTKAAYFIGTYKVNVYVCKYIYVCACVSND